MSDFSYIMGSNPGREFEVGWQYHGIPSTEEKVKALQFMVDLYGDSTEIWQCTPEIRHVPARAITSNFGRGPVKVMPDAWAVYGVLVEKPEKGWVPEGVRIPLYKDIKDQL